MNVVEFVTKVASKFAPVDAGTSKALEIELLDRYNKEISKIQKIMKTNESLNSQIENYEKDYQTAMNAGDSNAGADIANKIASLVSERHKLSVFQRFLLFFESPVVKLLLMIAFGFVVSFIAKKLTGKKEEVEDDDDLLNIPNGYNHMPNYQMPYYGYYPPHPQDTRFRQQK